MEKGNVREVEARNARAGTTLVLGGTGKTGRRVAEQLEARGLPVRVGSRSGEPPFDWANPGTWARAIEAGLKLVASKTSTTGVIVATYEPAGRIPSGSFAFEDPTEQEIERRTRLDAEESAGPNRTRRPRRRPMSADVVPGDAIEDTRQDLR